MDGLPGQTRASPQGQGRPALQPQPHGNADRSAEALWQPQVQAAPGQAKQWQVKASLVFMADPRFVVGRMLDPWGHCPQEHCRILESNG
jgi:hypothetical protein